MEQTREVKEVMQKLAHFIKEQRIKQGLTQSELCAKVNEMNPNISMDKFYLSKLENSNLDACRLETLSSIVTALNGKVEFSYEDLDN